MIERRRSVRRPLKGKVLIKARFNKDTSLGTMLDINSHSGVTIKLDEPLALSVGSRFEIAFVTNLTGKVSKIYFKVATVIHITDGKIGAIIGSRQPLIEDPLP